VLLHLAIIVSLGLTMALFRLGRADWDDSIAACSGQIVHELIDGGGWVLPLRNGRHIPVKPPLFYWLGALSAMLRNSGGDLLDPRLPSAVLAVLTLVVVYVFSRRWAGDTVALWAALILITTPQFIIEARTPRVDMTLCTFLTAGLLLAYRVWEGEGRRATALVAALCLGLATLSKGPLALGLTVLVLGSTALVAPPAPGWRVLIAPASLALAIGLPALWYGAATIEHGWAFLRLHFYSENVSRLLGKQGSSPPWWYAGPLLAGGLPWILALPALIWGESTLPTRLRRFLWVWVLAMLTFFCLSPGKRRAYLLVIRPALAILLASWVAAQLGRQRERRDAARPPRAVHLAIAALVVMGFICIFALRMGVGGFGSSETLWSYWWRQYFHNHLPTALALVVGVGIGTELIAHWGWQRKADLAAYAFVATLALGLTISLSAAAIVRGNGASFRPFAEQLSARVRPGEPLAFFDFDDEYALGLLFHFRRHIPVVQPRSSEAPCEPATPGLYLIAERNWDARACFHESEWQLLDRGGPPMEPTHRLVLARYTAVAAPPSEREP
jgi:hypothetical protein